MSGAIIGEFGAFYAPQRPWCTKNVLRLLPIYKITGRAYYRLMKSTMSIENRVAVFLSFGLHNDLNHVDKRPNTRGFFCRHLSGKDGGEDGPDTPATPLPAPVPASLSQCEIAQPRSRVPYIGVGLGLY